MNRNLKKHWSHTYYTEQWIYNNIIHRIVLLVYAIRLIKIMQKKPTAQKLKKSLCKHKVYPVRVVRIIGKAVFFFCLLIVIYKWTPNSYCSSKFRWSLSGTSLSWTITDLAFFWSCALTVAAGLVCIKVLDTMAHPSSAPSI